MSERRCCKMIVIMMLRCDTKIQFHLTVNGHDKKSRVAPPTVLGELEVVRVPSGNPVLGSAKPTWNS